MLYSKRIKNEGKFKLFKMHEFDIYATTDENDLNDENKKKTIIKVDDPVDIEKAFNAIDYVNKYPGIITVSLLDLYCIFKPAGVWKYKYISEKTVSEVKKQLEEIKCNTIFFSFFCNGKYTLFDYEDVINYYQENNKDTNIYFYLPYINDDDIDNIDLYVLYK